MRIQHNIMSMNAYRNYNNNTSALSKNLEKLSSGYKINRAGDDAAGLAISEKMRAQITGLEAAQKNVKDGISLINTAEGALQEVQNMLNRMVYLAEESANGTFDDKVDRKSLQDELEQLREEIDRISQSANFNGIKLLDGTWGGSASSADPVIGDDQQTAIDAIAADITGNTGAASFTDGDGSTQNATQTIDFSSLSFENAGTVDVTMGGQTYSVDVTAGMDGAAFATALKAAYDAGTGIADGDSGTFTATDDSSGTLTFTASGSTAIGSNPFEDFAIAAAEAAGDGDSDSAAGASFTVDLSGVGNIENGASYTIQVGSDTAVESDATTGTTTNDLAAAFDGKEVTVDGVVYTITAENDKLTFTEKTPGDTPTTAPADGTSITLADGTTNAPTNANNLSGINALATAEAQDGEEASESSSGNGLDLQIGDSSQAYDRLNVTIDKIDCKSLKIDTISFLKQDSSRNAIDVIKDAINQVSSLRGRLGAYSNRLDHTAQNLSVMRENIQDAESSIRDTDVAEEMMSYTKNNILVQSAQAMLAQANQVPQGVLQLLQ